MGVSVLQRCNSTARGSCLAAGRRGLTAPVPSRPTSIAVAAKASIAKPIAPARIQPTAVFGGTGQLWNMVTAVGW